MTDLEIILPKKGDTPMKRASVGWVAKVKYVECMICGRKAFDDGEDYYNCYPCNAVYKVPE